MRILYEILFINVIIKNVKKEMTLLTVFRREKLYAKQIYYYFFVLNDTSN